MSAMKGICKPYTVGSRRGSGTPPENLKSLSLLTFRNYSLEGDLIVDIKRFHAKIGVICPLRPPHGVPVDILAFSNKKLFTEEPTNILIVNIYIA